jgi:site-specific DNA-methyltransferase (adenine-specific)
VITDPPYGLGFMGKEWDSYDPTVNKGSFKVGTGTHPQGYVAIDKPAFQEFNFKWATECLRVLKPGGYLLAFGGTRTCHRLTCAIEDAGFEIRDMIAWVYGSGFPKSLNIGKAVDKKLGNEREVISEQQRKGRSAGILGKESIKEAGIMLNMRCPLDGEYKVGNSWKETH